ncbi:MAG TPA: ethanolamine ammonia-lyase light chain EutC, partial [Bryobacteraceae bacterium]|nr:ethanolamine ammonia-lyase light chain EutC [Bryobacteraceae bacterium]
MDREPSARASGRNRTSLRRRALTLHDLKRFTMARVALGRAGNSLPTRELLAFQLAHARARDAVHTPLQPHEIAAAFGTEALIVSSAARNRNEYLRRPDLGRQLDAASRDVIERAAGPYDVVFLIADGLSPIAVQKQA